MGRRFPETVHVATSTSSVQVTGFACLSGLELLPNAEK